MIRDFSDEVKERLCSQIDDIKDNEWCWFTDLISDLFLNIGRVANFISIKDDMSNIQTYQYLVLDMANYKKSDIQEIFEEVYAVEAEMCSPVKEINNTLKLTTRSLNKLAEGIGTGFSSTSAADLESLKDNLTSDLQCCQQVLTEFKAKAERDSLKMMAKSSAKNFAGSLVSGAAKVASMPASLMVSLVKEGPAGFAAEMGASGWELVNNVFTSGESLTTLATSTFGVAYTYLGMQKAADSAYAEARKYKGMKDFSDYVDSMAASNTVSSGNGLLGKINEKLGNLSGDFYKFLSYGSHTMDVAVTSYRAYSGVKDIVETVGTGVAGLGTMLKPGNGAAKGAEGAAKVAEKSAGTAQKTGKSFSLFGIKFGDVKDLDVDEVKAVENLKKYKEYQNASGKELKKKVNDMRSMYKEAQVWKQNYGNAKAAYGLLSDSWEMIAGTNTESYEKAMEVLTDAVDLKSLVKGSKLETVLDVKGDLDDIGKIKDQGEEFGKAWAKNREQEIKDKGFVNKSVDDWLTKNAYNWEEWNEKFKVSDIMIFAGA